MGTDTINSNSKILRRVDYTQIEDEITLFLRNNLTDRRNRTLNNTETFNINGSYLYELTQDVDNKGRHKVMNIKELSVDGIVKTYYKDYICGFKLRSNDMTSINTELGKIRFWNAPTGTQISVNYDYAYNFVWPQNNRVDLSTIDYPRVTIDCNGSVEDAGIGGCAIVHNISISIVVTDILIEGVRALVQEIKNIFVDNSVKQGFHHFHYITIGNIQIGPIVNAQDTNDFVYEQTISLSIPLEYEFSK